MPKSLFPMIVLSSLLLTTAPAWGAGSSPATYYVTTPVTPTAQPQNASPTSLNSLGEVVDFFNGQLNGLDSLISGGLSALNGGLGNLIGFILGDSAFGSLFGSNSPVGAFFRDVSALASLVNRVAGYPQRMSQWYNQAAAVLSGELNACQPNLSTVSGAVIPEYVFEPGYCLNALGRRGTHPVDSSSIPDLSDRFAGVVSRPLGPAAPQTSPRPNSPSLMEMMVKASEDSALGLPDPMKLRLYVGQTVQDATDGGDAFALNPVIARQYTLNNADRLVIRQNVNSILSESGQNNLQAGLDGSLRTISFGMRTAASAQGANSTQDVVKAMAEAQSQQTLLLGTIYNAQMYQRVDAALEQTALSNISRELDRQTNQRLNEQNAVLRSRLRKYSQIGLF